MNTMYVILVILLVKTIVSADDSSDETKFIDLLPEKEKEDFLEKIARRIANGVQSKDDRDEISGEVSEAELDAHDDYVKQLLIEESKNLRKSQNVYIDDKKAENEIDVELKEGEDVKDESLNKKETEAVDDDGLVDLTLRDGKRNKRNSFTKSKEDSKIIHVSVGNEEIGIPDKAIDLLNVPLTQDQHDDDNIQIKFFKHNPLKDTSALEITTHSSNSRTTQMTNFNAIDDSEESVKRDSIESVTTPENNVDKSSKDITVSRENKKEISNDDENTENSRFGSTQKILESLENENNKRDSEETNTVSESENSTPISEFTSPEVKVPVEITTELSNKNNTTEHYQNITPNDRALRSDTADLEQNTKLQVKDVLNENFKGDVKESEAESVAVVTVHNLEPQTNYNTATEIRNDLQKFNSDGNTTETFNLSSIANKEHTTEKNNDVGTITLKTEVQTLASLRTDEEVTVEEENKLKTGRIVNFKQFEKTIDHTKEMNSKDSIKNILKQFENNKNVEVYNKNKEEKAEKPEEKIYNLANDMIKALRLKITSESNSYENNFNGLRALYEAKKPNEYKVYAVPAGKQPFIQKDQQNTANKENPYYVPVYNYSPDNAYYNPHNRLGPNADDNDDNVINSNIEDERYDDLENEGENIDLNENDRSDDNDRIYVKRKLAGSGELVRNGYDKNRDKDVEDLVRAYNNYKKTRKFRFGNAKPKLIKKNPYKLNLPVVVQYPKFTNIILNPNDYLDMDYYYGRTNNKPYKRCEMNSTENNVFPDSTEQDHPLYSINHEKNLKTHIRSVRQLLFRQKHFGYIPEPNSTESVENEESSQNISKHALRSTQQKGKDSKSTDDNNIAMDYFFGRMHGDEPKTRVKKVGNKHSKSTRYKIDYRQYKNRNNLDNKYKGSKKDPIYIPYKGRVNYNFNKRDPSKEQSYYNDIKPVTPFYTVPKLRAWTRKEEPPDFKTIKKILSIADENDLLPTLDKLLKLKLTTRTKDEVNLEPYLTALRDMVTNDAKALKQYDWLQTTVDIQAALVKLKDMTYGLQNNITISQPDLQLLKYTIYLHKSAKTVQLKDFRKNTPLLPRNKKKKKGIITESGLLNRQWLIRMLGTDYEKIITKGDLNNFNEFLNDLQYYLYDLHTALQQIANITEFRSQRWFDNLKELYLDTTIKILLEVLLHITTTRLLDLVEESAKNGVEDDFLTFVMKNKKVVERAKDEMAFVLKIIDELKNK